MSVARKLLKQKTARGKQTLAGPSSLGSACDACVAHALSNTDEGDPYYWLGATIGTAVHEMLDRRARRHRNVLREHKVTIGDIPGYGTIKGSTDRFEIKTGTVRDFKTTLKKHVPSLKNAYRGDLETLVAMEADVKLRGYLGQGHMYGKALVEEGYDVKFIALDFICRDGSTDEDIFEFVYPYSQEFADAVWERVLYIHANLTTETFHSNPHCIGCALR